MEDHLEFLYQQLRQQLDAASAAPKWNPARVALVTGDLLRLEDQLARRNADDVLLSGYLCRMPTGTSVSSHSVA